MSHLIAAAHRAATTTPLAVAPTLAAVTLVQRAAEEMRRALVRAALPDFRGSAPVAAADLHHARLAVLAHLATLALPTDARLHAVASVEPHVTRAELLRAAITHGVSPATMARIWDALSRDRRETITLTTGR